MTYKSKRNIVEAIQYTGNNFNDIKEFAEGIPIREPLDFIGKTYGIMYIDILGNDKYIAMVGDYIIKEENKICVCSAEIFEMLFEEVEE